MKNRHVWVYDGKGGGHRGEYDFDCTVCGATDWVSGADLAKGKTPSTLGCSGVKGEMGSVLRELDDYARGVADERRAGGGGPAGDGGPDGAHPEREGMDSLCRLGAAGRPIRARRTRTGGNVTDDVKAAVEAAHARITAIEAKSGGEPDLRIGLWALEKVVDGEPARRAAAVAAAREEQRETIAQRFAASERILATPLTSTPLADRIAELERVLKEFRDKQALWDEDASFYLQTLRQADSIGALKDDLHDEREVSQSLREQLIAAEAERGALREEARAHAERCIQTDLIAVENERDALRAQVAAFAGPACPDEDCPDYDGKHPHHFDTIEEVRRLEVDVTDLRSTCAMLRAQVEAARAVAAMFKECDLGFHGARAVIAAMDGAKP